MDLLAFRDENRKLKNLPYEAPKRKLSENDPVSDLSSFEALHLFRREEGGSVLAKGWMNVTHYVRWDREMTSISKEALFQPYCAGAAVQGAPTQSSWDICIPIYTGTCQFYLALVPVSSA